MQDAKGQGNESEKKKQKKQKSPQQGLRHVILLGTSFVASSFLVASSCLGLFKLGSWLVMLRYCGGSGSCRSRCGVWWGLVMVIVWLSTRGGRGNFLLEWLKLIWTAATFVYHRRYVPRPLRLGHNSRSNEGLSVSVISYGLPGFAPRLAYGWRYTKRFGNFRSAMREEHHLLE